MNYLSISAHPNRKATLLELQSRTAFQHNPKPVIRSGCRKSTEKPFNVLNQVSVYFSRLGERCNAVLL